MGDLKGKDRLEEATMHRNFTGRREGLLSILWFFGRGLITCSVFLLTAALL